MRLNEVRREDPPESDRPNAKQPTAAGWHAALAPLRADAGAWYAVAETTTPGRAAALSNRVREAGEYESCFRTVGGRVYRVYARYVPQAGGQS